MEKDFAEVGMPTERLIGTERDQIMADPDIRHELMKMLTDIVTDPPTASQSGPSDGKSSRSSC